MELVLVLSLVFLSASVFASGLVVLRLTRHCSGNAQLQLTSVAIGGNTLANHPHRKHVRLRGELLRGAAYSAGSSLVSLAFWWVQHH
ncbi:hypothetical protein ACIRVF_39285 [Kitasatospora sp. NPDC101157]|uniref:hypothetical protein n=1 Tax=Kitasatospora sp. NPDC101157 TaxID=3364098 RepID=UPI003819E89F